MNNKATTAILACVVLFCSACGSRTESADQTTAIVKTAQATAATATQRKEFPFIAKPLRTSELSFRVSGPIDRFDVYAGNFYNRGNIIAEIDPRDFRLRRERTEAIYRQAKAEYERIEMLYQKNNISASTYEKVRAEYISAKTAFDTAENELNDTKLLAPFDGYVGEVYIEKFQDVKASQRIVSLVDIGKLKIEVYVTQDVVMLASGLKKIDLSFDSEPNKVYVADVVEYSRSTTPNNLSYLLTAILPNPGGKLPAGLSGKVFFDVSNATGGSVLIPQTALCHQSTQGDYVWIVDPATRKVSRRSVVPGKLQPGGMSSILQGVSPGETVAVSGLRFLSEGAVVEPDDQPHVQPVQGSAL